MTKTTELHTELERQGFTLTTTRNGNTAVTRNGKHVTTIPNAGDSRSVKNAGAEARRHGFDWARRR